MVFSILLVSFSVWKFLLNIVITNRPKPIAIYCLSINLKKCLGSEIYEIAENEIVNRVSCYISI